MSQCQYFINILDILRKIYVVHIQNWYKCLYIILVFHLFISVTESVQQQLDTHDNIKKTESLLLRRPSMMTIGRCIRCLYSQ